MSPMNLGDVLADVVVSAARPRLVAAAAHADRTVRWVHASEQLDVAPLLRGGELILMEGANFRSRTDAELADYVTALRSADVAGLAVETIATCRVIPPAILARAEVLGLPVVALRRRVPFVEVCESVNSRLSTPALRRLHLANRLSRVLMAAADADDAVTEVMEVLARETRSSVVVRAASGATIGRVGSGRPRGDLTDFDAAVTVADRPLGTLVLVPGPESDIHRLDVGLERAPAVLALALSEAGCSREARAVRRLFTLLVADPRVMPDLPALLDAAADRVLPADSRHLLSVVSETGVDPMPGPSAAARRVTHDLGEERLTVLAFPTQEDLDRSRRRLLQGTGPSAAVGPGARTPMDLRRCLAAARSTHSLHARRGSGPVLDARHFALARLLDSLSAEGAFVVGDFVDEQIGPILAHDRDRRGSLFETLAMLLNQGGSRTDTAAALGIRRQTLYKRLDRLDAVLGPLPTGSPRLPAVATAVFLEEARRRRHGRSA